jgi:hypothetical protein
MNNDFDIFKIGYRYRVKRDFQVLIYKFTSGEILVYKNWGFIPYDGAYGYGFHSENDPKDARDKVWRLYADEPPETWHNFFELVD